MNKIIFDEIVECSACDGTGLYKGMAEGGGAAVICYRCEGAGKRREHYTFTKFEGRKIRNDVTRVFKTAGGYGITDKDIQRDDGKVIKFSAAGIEYDKWLNGENPEPIKDLHCPLEHFGQGTDIGENLKDCGPCSEHLTVGGYIPRCSELHRKECWKEIGE